MVQNTLNTEKYLDYIHSVKSLLKSSLACKMFVFSQWERNKITSQGFEEDVLVKLMRADTQFTPSQFSG